MIILLIYYQYSIIYLINEIGYICTVQFNSFGNLVLIVGFFLLALFLKFKDANDRDTLCQSCVTEMYF